MPGQPRSIYNHLCLRRGKGGRKVGAAALQGVSVKHPTPIVPSHSQCRQTYSRSRCSAPHTSHLPLPNIGAGDPHCSSATGICMFQVWREIPNSAGWDRRTQAELSQLAGTGTVSPPSSPICCTAFPISLASFSPFLTAPKCKGEGVSLQHALQRALFILHLKGKEEKAKRTCLAHNLLHKCQLSAIDSKHSRRAVFIS